MLTNSVDVLILTAEVDRWQIKVDDMQNVSDVKASSTDTGSDQDGTFASSKRSTGTG